jgi:soluble lytic murein transglycosylase
MNYHPSLIIGALTSLLWLSGAQAQVNDPYAAARGQFKAAYTAVEAALPEPANLDEAVLRDYPLYAYLQAARLRRTVVNTAGERAPVDEAVEKFLWDYTDEPPAEELRRTWLMNLAQRQQWPSFVAQYRSDTKDVALRCHSLTANIATGRTEKVAAQALQEWLSDKELPTACDPAVRFITSLNLLTPALYEQRARLALRAGNTALARKLAANLPENLAAPIVQWAGLIESPQNAIDKLIAAPAQPVEGAALQDSWLRLTKKSSSAALERYAALLRSREPDEKQIGSMTRALALGLAYDRRPEALGYFAKLRREDLDDNALEWQTRAALWAGDWKTARRAIESMGATQRNMPRWRYWAARAAEQLDDKTRARELYIGVLTSDNFFSAMAAAHLKKPVAPHPRPLIADETELARLERLPPFIRARELWLTGLRGFAFAEWRKGAELVPADQQAQPVHLAARWGWYDNAIITASALKIYDDYMLLYPRPYDAQVHATATATGIDRHLLYGLLRQESLYQVDATSPVGALGLMQLMPASARTAAKRLGRPPPSATDLTNPAVNVPLGAEVLGQYLERFENQPMLALASYNAGPEAVARWLPSEKPVAADIWVENIPYNETRGYVQRVLWHSVVFAWLENGKPQKTGSWITTIKPLKAAATTPSKKAKKTKKTRKKD